MTRSFALAALLALASATPALAHAGHDHHKATGQVMVMDAWARETAPAQANGGAFMTIMNHAAAPDRLISGGSPAAAKVELHTMSMDGGVMRMRQLTDGIAIPANGMVELKPGAMHIMLIGLKGPLKKGETVKLVLRFEKAGAVRLDVPVRGIGEMAAQKMDMNHGAH